MWPFDFTDETNLRRVLSLMPSPLFRQRDAYLAVEKLNQPKNKGQTAWNELVKRGWIVRTGHQLGGYRSRFYWERVSGFEGPQR